MCVTSTANSLDTQADPRFGRCPYLLIIESENMQFEAIHNTTAGATSGTGFQAAQKIASKGVKLLITGNVGPKAFQALFAAGIEIVTGAFSNVIEAVDQFKKGELNKTDTPTVGGHFGIIGKGAVEAYIDRRQF